MRSSSGPGSRPLNLALTCIHWRGGCGKVKRYAACRAARKGSIWTTSRIRSAAAHARLRIGLLFGRGERLRDEVCFRKSAEDLHLIVDHRLRNAGHVIAPREIRVLSDLDGIRRDV